MTQSTSTPQPHNIITRRQAFTLVDIADTLVNGLIPDHDCVKVDALTLRLDDALIALCRNQNADAARLAALIIAVMAGPDAPSQTPGGS